MIKSLFPGHSFPSLLISPALLCTMFSSCLFIVVCLMLKKKKFLSLMFIDTETTWLSCTDQILQFAAICGTFDGKNFRERHRINQYINITTKINFFAQRVHGINKSMVEQYWYIDTYIDGFLKHITTSDHIIGHNISFDIRMLQQDCIRIKKHYDWNNLQTFCTMKDINHVSDLPKKDQDWVCCILTFLEKHLIMPMTLWLI